MEKMRIIIRVICSVGLILSPIGVILMLKKSEINIMDIMFYIFYGFIVPVVISYNEFDKK